MLQSKDETVLEVDRGAKSLPEILERSQKMKIGKKEVKPQGMTGSRSVIAYPKDLQKASHYESRTVSVTERQE